MNRTSILPALLLFVACCSYPPLDTGSGGAGGDTSSPPGECDSAADCDPAINGCYVGACQPCDPSRPTCAQQAECDDGDPLTADRCAAVTAGCAEPACVHLAVECNHCGSVEEQQSICDDGDPCTSDRCGENACVQEPIANCP